MQLAVTKLLYEENEGAYTIKRSQEKVRRDCSGEVKTTKKPPH